MLPDVLHSVWNKCMSFRVVFGLFLPSNLKLCFCDTGSVGDNGVICTPLFLSPLAKQIRVRFFYGCKKRWALFLRCLQDKNSEKDSRVFHTSPGHTAVLGKSHRERRKQTC